MQGIRIASGLSVLALLIGNAAVGQTLQEVTGPAERPPLSYKGSQYVDSRGCVFVRAGYGGNVTWIPRVDRGRNVVCGAKPTPIAGSETVDPASSPGEPAATVRAKPATTTASAPKAKAAAPARVVRQAPAATTPPRAATAPAEDAPTALRSPPREVRTRRILRPAPAPTVAPRPAGPRVTAPARSAPVRTAPVTAPLRTAPVEAAPAAPVTAGPRRQPACDYGTASNRYVNSGSRFPVRCGPQAEHPSDSSVRGGAPRSFEGSDAGSYIQPPAPAAPRVALTPRPVHMPAGYRSVWDDGRLNPKRGVGKLSGAIETSLVWTQTVPRRLIDQRTGRDVTTVYSYLTYPYTDYAAQKRALRARAAQVQGATVRKAAAPGVNSGHVHEGHASTRRPRMSSKGLPTQSLRQERRAAGGGLVRSVVVQVPVAGGPVVEVGYYGERAAAEQTAAQLRKLGMPAQLASVNSGGRQLSLVLSGPFGSDAEANRAVSRLRAVGYSRAILR